MSAVESVKQKQASTGSLQNSCFKQFFGKLPGRPTSVHLHHTCFTVKLSKIFRVAIFFDKLTDVSFLKFKQKYF